MMNIAGMKSAAKFSLILVAFAALSGCAAPKPPPTMLDSSYDAVDSLATQVKRACGGYCPNGVGSVLVATLANVDDLGSSSTFGRIASEQVGSRLVQDGFKIIEARMGSAFVVRPSGEFILSSSVRDLAQQQNASAVLVGTYAASDQQVFVTLKLVRLSNNVVIAASDYVAALDPGVSSTMFKTSSDTPAE